MESLLNQATVCNELVGLLSKCYADTIVLDERAKKLLNDKSLSSEEYELVCNVREHYRNFLQRFKNETYAEVAGKKAVVTEAPPATKNEAPPAAKNEVPVKNEATPAAKNEATPAAKNEATPATKNEVPVKNEAPPAVKNEVSVKNETDMDVFKHDIMEKVAEYLEKQAFHRFTALLAEKNSDPVPKKVVEAVPKKVAEPEAAFFGREYQPKMKQPMNVVAIEKNMMRGYHQKQGLWNPPPPPPQTTPWQPNPVVLSRVQFPFEVVFRYGNDTKTCVVQSAGKMRALTALRKALNYKDVRLFWSDALVDGIIELYNTKLHLERVGDRGSFVVLGKRVCIILVDINGQEIPYTNRVGFSAGMEVYVSDF